MKQIIRLTESDLNRIIKKSVNRIMEAEGEDDNFMSPLQRIKANGPKVIGKIDLPEPKPRKPKGPKRTTFADLPSAEKLKNLKVNKTQSADDINIDSVVTPEQMAAVKSGHINIPSLFENRINRIVKESVNEISRKKALDVSSDMGKFYEDIANDFNEFYSTLHFSLQGNSNNRYLQEIMKHAKAIGDILSRKLRQSSDIEDAVWSKSFEDWAAENPNYTDDEQYWEDQI